MVKGRLQRGAVDHASLTVAVAVVVATLMERQEMNMGVPLAGPMSAAVVQAEDMR